MIASKHSFVVIKLQSGFTLIELMITIVVAATLATLAGPSFVSYIANQRLRNASYDLVAAFQVARSEAIKRNAAIDVVRTSSSWAGGWTVQSSGTVIRAQDSYSNLAITNPAGFPSLATVTYGNDGRATTASTVFKIEPAISIAAVTARCVTISLSGIPISKVGGC